MKTLKIIVGMLIFSLMAPTVLAVDPVLPPLDAMCPDDYYGFILTVRDENTRHETFSDLFTLGYCQLNDILELDSELDALKEDFRNAAFECKDTGTYKKKYQEILMEQYFVRYVQESKSDVLNSKDEETLAAMKEEKLKVLKEEMRGLFVAGEDPRVTEDTFDSYFDSWSLKYDDRIADYRHCEEGAAAELSETWNDFWDTVKGLEWQKPDTDKNPWEGLLDKEAMKESAGEEWQDFGKTFINAWDYLTKENVFTQMKVESAATPETVANSEADVTFEEALKALSEGGLTYDSSSSSAERMARYKMLYGYGGSVMATDLQGVLNALNGVVSDTNTKDFPKIAVFLSKIYDKQCN